MVPDTHVRHVESIIDYHFCEANYLVKALTAAGVDEYNHDGNRKLAQLGDFIIKLVLVDNSFNAGDGRGKYSWT